VVARGFYFAFIDFQHTDEGHSLLAASISANQTLSHLGFKGTARSYFEPHVYAFILIY